MHFCWPKKDLITYLTDSTGYIAIIILAISLIVGSLKLILNQNTPISFTFRRDLGLTGSVFTLAHSICGLFVHFRGNSWQYFFTKTGQTFTIRLDDFGLANYFGLFSAFLILLLMISSNNYSIRKLSPGRWKNFQRLTYLMFILAITHCVYYRVVLNSTGLIYSFYLPMLLIILGFQIIGIQLKLREAKNMSK